MIIDKLVLINGEIFEGYRENETAPERRGFMAIYKPEANNYTRYINISHILYAQIENEKIEKDYEEFIVQH